MQAPCSSGRGQTFDRMASASISRAQSHVRNANADRVNRINCRTHPLPRAPARPRGRHPAGTTDCRLASLFASGRRGGRGLMSSSPMSPINPDGALTQCDRTTAGIAAPPMTNAVFRLGLAGLKAVATARQKCRCDGPHSRRGAPRATISNRGVSLRTATKAAAVACARLSNRRDRPEGELRC